MFLKPQYLQHVLAMVFPHRVKRQLRELYIATTLNQVASAGLALFETIYLWTLGYDLQTIAVFWLLVYVAYFFLIPLGAKATKRFGAEPMIALGAVLYVVYLGGLYAIEAFPWMLFFTPVLYAISKMFYWPAFHFEFAQYIDGRQEGEEVGDYQILSALAAVAGPIAGGLLVESLGFLGFFVVAGITVVLSNWPMLRTPERFQRESYAYTRPYRSLFSKQRRRDLLVYVGFGEELVALAIWPIFVYVVVKDFSDSGLVIGISTALTILITFFLGRATDHLDRRKLIRAGTFLNVLLWLARLIPQTPLIITAIDTASRSAKNAIAIPLVAMVYDDSKHEDSMDQILVYEMGLVVGKIVAALVIVMALFFVGGFAPFFVIAALMSILYAFR